MTSNYAAPVPLDPDDENIDSGDAVEEGTIERDGEVQLDPDVDEDRVDSAEADRLASGADTDDPGVLGL
ncbi:hypothetical protein [Protaetiibacter mangrovi]|uniref:Sugar ABC transporter ATPase n=1 Tax=Protaetiibacter mangrovi TaxID=2970926 RepID=A0ABT1ZCZ2_9MICO|nr:hypothetical protein [Protaetiibacter mangrovi]MCS0498562.1 hypothetical protein [Protaetiibacter mangrovi]TPX05054.1 hypothetical protein FJ656_08605 [Schumannella luteola]